MPKTAAEMVAEAKARVPAITPEEASAMDNVIFVDLREASEIEASGKIAGAVAKVVDRTTFGDLAEQVKARESPERTIYHI